MKSFENRSVEQLASGYAAEDNGSYTCLLCGRVFEHGEIFPIGGRFYDAERAVKLHLESEHKERFEELLNSGSKYLSLTDNQRELLSLFYEGLSDKEIAERLEVAPSTVRHQKFMFREKAKAAALYCAVWSMVETNKRKQAERSSKTEDTLLPVHEGATMVDERYEITEAENEKILKGVFSSLEPLRLGVFSSKEKKKIVILRRLVQEFEPGRRYTEKEVNAILGEIYEDTATLRRYLVEYGYMERTRDCREYWRK